MKKLEITGRKTKHLKTLNRDELKQLSGGNWRSSQGLLKWDLAKHIDEYKGNKPGITDVASIQP